MVWTKKRNTSSIVAKNKKEPGQGHWVKQPLKMIVFKLFPQQLKKFVSFGRMVWTDKRNTSSIVA